MKIVTSGNTVVPAILALESMGFEVRLDDTTGFAGCEAIRDGVTYTGDDPVCVLGLVKLIEVRGREWSATDEEIETTLQRFGLG